MKLKYKIVSFVLVALLSLTGLPSNIVSADDSGEILKDLGILKGDLSGDLLLDQPLKRQDVIVLLSRLLGVEELAENFPGQHTFTDVVNSYYDPFIAWAETSGLTEGIGGGFFGFDQQLKNQQLLAFLLRALGYEFYGEDYGLVPGKAVDLGISPSDEDWDAITLRQLMADRTVALLRAGRVKYGNITLERSLALNDDTVMPGSSIFVLDEFVYKKGSVLFKMAPASDDYNSSRSNSLKTLINEGPSITDFEVALRIGIDGQVTVLKLQHQFYDPSTGQLLATFDPPGIPVGSTVEVLVTYLENREAIAHEAAHVLQQKSPGTYEPGELILILEEILRDVLPSFSGTFSSEEINNSDSKTLNNSNGNPLYESNSTAKTSPLYRTDSFFDIFTEITLLDNVISPNQKLIFNSVLVNGESLDVVTNVSSSSDGRTVYTEMVSLSLSQAGPVVVVTSYMNKGELVDAIANDNGLSAVAVNLIFTELSVQLHLSQKPDAITSTSVFGQLTVHSDKLEIAPLDLKTVSGVIVGTSITNPELDDEVIVAIKGKGMQDLKSNYSIHDYGDEFPDVMSAYRSFSRYLDPDSDGDGLDDLVFMFKGEPVKITKPVDKSTPILMVADGGLGDHVSLHLENGEVAFWHDGPDNDCDGTEDDDMRTTTYIDTITVDAEASSLRTGRNPQTGKEIKIAATTVIIVTDEHGTATTHTQESFRNEVREEVSFAYSKVVSDENSEAILIHIINNAEVVYVETREIDKSSTKLLWTNIPDLTEEEIVFLLSGQVDAEIFVYRQQFGPVQASSARFYQKRKFAEFIDYSPESPSTRGNVVRFKAGSDLSGKVNAAPPDDTCGTTILGESPDMAAMAAFIKFDGIDGEAKAVMIVDSFFDVFTELSVDFRGHVTVLK